MILKQSLISPFVIFLCNRDTLPPWKKDISIKGISIPSSLEQTLGNYALSFGNIRQLSTPPCSTYQYNLPYANRKWYSEEILNDGCIYNKELSVNLSFICIISHVYFISASLKCVNNFDFRGTTRSFNQKEAWIKEILHCLQKER